MNKFVFILIAALFALTNIACTPNTEQELALSQSASKQLGKQLKNKLVSTIQSEGPEAAITICNLEAVEISKKISVKNNLKVGRTSLKLRNPTNQADAWETKQLHWFESQKNLNVDIKTLEISEVVKEDGEKIFRYMKAIPMQEPCLLCHGKKLAPVIAEKINDLYPEDQATGFQAGDIRGAFTVKINL